MTRDDLESLYRERRESVLAPMATRIQDDLIDRLKGCQRINCITARAKSIDRFLAKAKKVENSQNKYSDPLNQIQDQVGARVVTLYLSDVEAIAAEVDRYFRKIEDRTVVAEVDRYFRKIEDRTVVPDSDKEFGYFGKHYILFIPEDVLVAFEGKECPKFFELQIKTLFQHAWSEAEHDIGYKPTIQLTSDQKRKIAFTAAQAWGADKIFEELLGELGALTH